MNLPQIPTPPTDNLYKFMAISGVVLIIVSPIFWAHFHITQTQRTRLAFETLAESLPPAEYMMAEAKIRNAKVVTEEEKKLVEKYDALLKESRLAGSEYLAYADFTNVVTGVAIVLGTLGVVLSASGFILWYCRVQVPLDRILAKQAKEADEDSTPENSYSI
jgi:hypothetical protein